MKKKQTKDTKCTTRDHDNLNVVSNKYLFKDNYIKKMSKGSGNYPILCSKYKIRFSAQNKSCGDGNGGGENKYDSGIGINSTNIEIQDIEEVVDALV